LIKDFEEFPIGGCKSTSWLSEFFPTKIPESLDVLDLQGCGLLSKDGVIKLRGLGSWSKDDEAS